MTRFAKPLIAVALPFLLSAGAAKAAIHMVELDGAPGAVWAAEERAAGRGVDAEALEGYRASLRAAQDQFLASLDADGVEYQLLAYDIPDATGFTTAIEARYTLVLNGFALDLDPAGVAAVEQRPEVTRVQPARRHELQLDRSVAYVRAQELYGAVHELTQFDDLREGYEGQGIYVSIIDSGVTWEHPMFGGDPTPPRFALAPESALIPTNDKVVYYLSLMENYIDDFGHGTHVAATAAGYRGFAPGDDGLPNTADDVPVHGVAPQAKIMGYKVCSGVGSASATVGCLSPTIALAIEDSVSPRTLNGLPKPVAHVINMSLGGSGNPDDTLSTAASNAALLGAIVVAAAGNDGPGEFTIGSPSTGRHVISVGASNDSGVAPNRIDVLPANGTDPGLGPIPATLAPDSNATLAYTEPLTEHYVFAGFADTPDQVPLEVMGRICLVERGGSVEVEEADQSTGLFASKSLNCAAKGAIATVVFNNVPGEIGGALAPSPHPVFTMSRENGLTLMDLGFDAGGISNFPIRLGLKDLSLFEPEMAGFSSRGPVAGLGQVKPDLSAPGVEVLAAASTVGVPVLSLMDPTGYVNSNGTSMATPHVAGAAALLKQAHPSWTPAMVRAALMNASTNPRESDGSPEADGRFTNSVLEMGAGLMDVAATAAIPGLLGVAGDGVTVPSILASHSFGEVPVINSRVSHTETVTLTLRDLTGAGGVYDLAVSDNRDLDVDGIDATVSTSAVTVPAGGSATFDASLTVDGDRVRELFPTRDFNGVSFQERVQPQWFVRATHRDSGRTLSMPLYYRAAGSRPAGASSVITETFSDTLPASDTGLFLAEDATFHDYEVEADGTVFRIEADLAFGDVAGGLPDLDLFLFDPDGNEVASSTNAGGPEALGHTVLGDGTYIVRVNGWVSAATDYDLEIRRQIGGAAPDLAPIQGESVENGEAVDFDGAFTVSWTGSGDEAFFELERSVDGGDWEPVGSFDGATTTASFSGEPNGRQDFRVRGLFPAQIGFFEGAASDVEGVTIDHRTPADVTGDIGTAVANVSFSGGVFQLDLLLTNQSGGELVPHVEAAVVAIQSSSGTVALENADNGGSGQSAGDPGAFDYSNNLGGDFVWQIGETTSARTLRFADPAAELFTFTLEVTAHSRVGGASAARSGGMVAAGSSAVLAVPVRHRVSFTVDPARAMVSRR